MNENRDLPNGTTAAAQDNPAQRHFDRVLEQLHQQHAGIVAPERRQDAAALIVEAAASNGFKATEDIALIRGNKDNLIAMQGDGPSARTASIALNEIKPGEFDRVSQRMSLSNGQPGMTSGVEFPDGQDRGQPERTRGSGGRFASSNDGVEFPSGEDRGQPERTRGSGGRFASSNDGVEFPSGEDRGQPERTRGSGGRFASSNDGVEFPSGEDRGQPERTRGSGGRFASSNDGVEFPSGEDRGQPERTRGSGGRFAESTERNDGRLTFAMPEAQADAPSHGSLRR